jgi:hypothetical protein
MASSADENISFPCRSGLHSFRYKNGKNAWGIFHHTMGPSWLCYQHKWSRNGGTRNFSRLEMIHAGNRRPRTYVVVQLNSCSYLCFCKGTAALLQWNTARDNNMLKVLSHGDWACQSVTAGPQLAGTRTRSRSRCRLHRSSGTPRLSLSLQLHV